MSDGVLVDVSSVGPRRRTCDDAGKDGEQEVGAPMPMACDEMSGDDCQATNVNYCIDTRQRPLWGLHAAWIRMLYRIIRYAAGNIDKITAIDVLRSFGVSSGVPCAKRATKSTAEN